MQIDQLAIQTAFGDKEKKAKARKEIKSLCRQEGILPASINEFYLARARGEIPDDFTVPAINLRGLTYDIGQVIFSLAKKLNIGAFILEIARSEINYTGQPPEEYATLILAAALKSGFRGPVFLQGDHFQLKNDNNREIQKIKRLISQAVKAGFYNIDIDASTLVDYSYSQIDRQQEKNYKITAQLAKYIRFIQPKGVTISIGAEIGHIGGKNSTPEELAAFMRGFKNQYNSDLAGLSKISIQTGTHHGGVVLPDGSLAKVKLDFSLLKKMGKLAKDYGMAGAVQHGASTLPEKYFSLFPKCQTLEIHLATEFQNLIFDHQFFPKPLLSRIYQWLDKNYFNFKDKNQTIEQFHYKMRKNAWAKFKKDFWELPKNIKMPIMETLKENFTRLFKNLKVNKNKKLVNKYCLKDD